MLPPNPSLQRTRQKRRAAELEYRWRLSPHLKARLEEAAREEQKSLAELLAEISEAWLRQSHRAQGAEEERQQRLWEAALPFLGAVEGSRPDRAENARAELRRIPSPRPGPRPFGLCAGAFTVPDDFDAPLPEEILREFEG